MIKENTRYKIKTPDGYKDFYGMQKVVHNEYYNIIFDGNINVKSSINHPFIRNGKVFRASNLNVNDYIDGTNGKKIYVKKIDYIKGKICLYDLLNVSDDNIFVINNSIISHNCSFLTSGDSVIDLEIIEAHRKKNACDPIEKRYAGKFWIWKYPEANHKYIVSVDVSRGDSEDKSAFHIWDIETLEQVGEYVGLIDPYDLGTWTVNVALEYNSALLVIENNGLGYAAIEGALHRRYGNLYYSGKAGTKADIGKRVKNLLKSNDDKVPGFSNTMITRPLMINKMERFFREEAVIVHSNRLLNELLTFIYKKGGKAEAISGKRDDLTLSAAIGLYVRDTAITLLQESVKSTKRMLKYTGKLTSKQMYNDNDNDDPWKASVSGQVMNLREFL